MAPVEVPTIRFVSQGETICTDATWTSVTKFILLNYVTHVFTVMQHPGARNPQIFSWMLTALFMPFAGTWRAITVIMSYPSARLSSCATALRCGAVYMVVGCNGAGAVIVPTAFAAKGMNLKDFQWNEWQNDFKHVHGDHPVVCDTIRKPRDDAQRRGAAPTDDDTTRYHLVRIPPDARIEPLHEGLQLENMEIPNSYSLVQGAAAIAQIFFASKELYASRGDQVVRYGYAAFGLTVIPYLWMSFLNLVAAIFRPQYSHVYLVHYGEPAGDAVAPPACDNEGGEKEPPHVDIHEVGGKELERRRKLDGELRDSVVGAVGVVYIRPEALKERPYYTFKPFLESLKKHHGIPVKPVLEHWATLCKEIGQLVIWAFSLVIPYIVIYIMTRFEAAESTTAQRFAVVGWLATGQVLALILPFLRLYGESRAKTIYSGIMITFLIPVGVYSVVNVSKMILEKGVCVQL